MSDEILEPERRTPTDRATERKNTKLGVVLALAGAAGSACRPNRWRN